MESKKKTIILVLAFLLLILAYFYKGIPMLASLLVGYFFLYKAYVSYLEKKIEQGDTLKK